MATVQSASSTTTFSSVIQPSENDVCLSRTTKIALAIFAVLAGFVFLPFPAAITLGLVVTIGGVVCLSGGENPPMSSSGQQSKEEAEPASQPASHGSFPQNQTTPEVIIRPSHLGDAPVTAARVAIPGGPGGIDSSSLPQNGKGHPEAPSPKSQQRVEKAEPASQPASHSCLPQNQIPPEVIIRPPHLGDQPLAAARVEIAGGPRGIDSSSLPKNGKGHPQTPSPIVQRVEKAEPASQPVTQSSPPQRKTPVVGLAPSSSLPDSHREPTQIKAPASMGSMPPTVHSGDHAKRPPSVLKPTEKAKPDPRTANQSLSLPIPFRLPNIPGVTLDRAMPARIEIPDRFESLTEPDHVIITFKTENAKKYFMDIHGGSFVNNASLRTLPGKPAVLAIKSSIAAKREGKGATFIIHELQKIFGREKIANVLCLPG